MKIWRDKQGRWIDAKEFKERFAKGVEGVTPLQQTKTQLLFTWITIVGLLCGVVVSIIAWKTLWWLCIILVAAIGNTLVGLVGLYQKYKQLKIMQDIMDNHKLYEMVKDRPAIKIEEVD